MHINNAIEEEEAELSTVTKFATTASDGNKRIAATIFLYFLNKNGLLFKDGLKQIDDNTLYVFYIPKLIIFYLTEIHLFAVATFFKPFSARILLS